MKRKILLVSLILICTWFFVGIPVKKINNTYDSWIVKDVNTIGYLEKGNVTIKGIMLHKLFQEKKFIGNVKYNFTRDIEPFSMNSYSGHQEVEWIYQEGDLFGWSLDGVYQAIGLILGKENEYHYILPTSFENSQMFIFGNLHLEDIKDFIRYAE